MTDATIQTNTPNGSPILAYGEVRGSRRPHWNLILVTIVAIVLIVLGGVAYLMTRPIHLPDHVIAIAALHGGTPLPEALPAVWRNAAESTHGTMVIGLSQDANGWMPFAVVPRWVTIGSGSKHADGLVAVWTDEPIRNVSTRSLWSLVQLTWAARGHAAYLDLDLTRSLNNGSTLAGPIDGNIWYTNAQINTPSSLGLPNGDIAVDLTALPDAWPSVRSALADAGLDLEQAPETLSWTSTTSALPLIELRAAPSLPTSTRQAVAALGRRADFEPITLPDGTLAERMLLPNATSVSAYTDWEAVSGTRVRLTETTASVLDGVNTSSTPPCDDATVIAHLSRSAMTDLFHRVIPGLRLAFDLSIAEKDGKALVCVSKLSTP